MIEKMEGIYTLHDDEGVRKKLTVMSKWDALLDDARNPTSDFAERLEALLKLGKSYRVTMTVEEV
jgi:hypothetical protein